MKIPDSNLLLESIEEVSDLLEVILSVEISRRPAIRCTSYGAYAAIASPKEEPHGAQSQNIGHDVFTIDGDDVPVQVTFFGELLFVFHQRPQPSQRISRRQESILQFPLE